MFGGRGIDDILQKLGGTSGHSFSNEPSFEVRPKMEKLLKVCNVDFVFHLSCYFLQ